MHQKEGPQGTEPSPSYLLSPALPSACADENRYRTRDGNLSINYWISKSKQSISLLLSPLPQHRFKNIYVHTDPLKTTENAVVHITDLWVALDIHQKWRRRDGVCALSLHAVNKQTADGETKHNKKKMKMASARKPESLVWTINEVELLLWLTLNYKASKLQERFNIFCGTNTSM